MYFFQKQWRKNRKVILSFLLLLTIILTFSFIPTSAEKQMDENAAQLGTSNIAYSSTDSIRGGEVTIAKTGSIATGNLMLQLSWPTTDVEYVTMTTPDGAVQTLQVGASAAPLSTITPTDKNETLPSEERPPILGESGSKPSSAVTLGTSATGETPDTSPNLSSKKPTLGSSGDNPPIQMANFNSNISFSISAYGMHVFNLYGANDEVLYRTSYIVQQVLNEDALTISITTGEPYFNLQDKQNVYVRYVPQLIGSKEILTIVVPPFINIARPPESAPGYVVSTIGTMKLPEELYDDAASDILKEFMKNRTVRYFTITFDGSIDQGMGFSFDTQFYTGYSPEVSQLMRNYGNDYDKIPMRIGGFSKSEDGSILVDKDSVNGTPLVKDDNILLLPKANTNITISPKFEGGPITKGLTLEPMRVVSWHYPITDVRLYIAYDPAVITPKSTSLGHQETFDNVTYWVKTLTEAELSSFHTINKGLSYLYNYGDHFDFPTDLEIKKNDVFNFGPILIDFTYKGVEYKHVNAGNTQPFTIGNYYDMSCQFKVRGASGAWGTAPRDRELEQGSSGEKFWFEYTNMSNYHNNPTYAYEEAQVIFDLPWGFFPTDIYLPDSGRGNILNVEYYLVGDSTPHFDSPTGTNIIHNFNIGPDDKISKIIINYDMLAPVNKGAYRIFAKIGTHNPDGSLMAPSVDATIVTTIKTKNDMKTMGMHSADPVYEPYTFSNSQSITLIRYELEDSLRFGTVYRKRAFVTMYDNEGSKAHVNAGAGFIKFTQRMKDYNDVVIEVGPYQGDGRALSLVTGYTFSGLTAGTHVERTAVYYKSNLKPNWTPAETVSINNHFFDLDLARGEYVTGVKADLGTLYGSALTGSITATSSVTSTGFSHITNVPQHMFIPIIDQSKRAFPTDDPTKPNGIPFPEEDTLTEIVYTVSTSTEAQYINRIGIPSPTHNANKALAEAYLYTYARQGFGFSTMTSTLLQTSQFQGGTFIANVSISGSRIDRNPELEYYARVYFEMHPDFSILSIPNATLVDTIIASDTGNKVYVYDTYLGKNSNYFSRPVTLFLHPDAAAPVSGVAPFVKAGISEDAFLTSYMSTNDYFHEPPYTIYTPVGKPVYPTWNVQPNLFWPLDLYPQHYVSTQLFSLTSVQLNATINGNVQGSSTAFRNHEKNTLGVYATMGNNSGGIIPHYEAKFEIPKTDRPTRTPNIGTPTVPLELTNEYSLSLRGPISVDPNLDNLVVTYLTKDGSPIIVNSSTSATDLERVYDVIVRFDNLLDRHNEMVEIPLTTTLTKVGADFHPYKAFVGAEARFAPSPGAWGSFALSHALEFRFDSYSVGARIGRDRYEIGRLQEVLNDSTLVKLTSYAEINGSLVPLETLSVAGTFWFNQDAHSIKAEVLRPDAFQISPPHYIADVNNDSDYIITSPVGTPPIKGEVPVAIADLINNTKNIYDIAVYALPAVSVADTLNLTAYTSKTETPSITEVYRNIAMANTNYYLREISNISDPTIATITYNPATYKIDITALKLGETTYELTIENRFGDRVKVIRPIRVTVAPNYVPTARLGKTFDGTSSNLEYDYFSFDIWTGDSVDDTSNLFTTTGVNQQNNLVITQLRRGETHYIREIVKTGYELVSFTVTNGGVSIPVTHVKEDIYSFVLPTDANNVQIRGINKNTTTPYTVRKYMDAASVAVNPNQEFTITLARMTSPPTAQPIVTTPIDSSQYKAGDSKLIPELGYGQTYTITETLVDNYLLDKITIEKNGVPLSVQPHIHSINAQEITYIIKFLPSHAGGEIVVRNKLAIGKGLALKKYIDQSAGLPGETFTFELKGPTTERYYGIVRNGVLVFPAKVTWYLTPDHTGPVQDITTLKVGDYSLTETSGTNYQLDQFTLNAGSWSAGTTAKEVLFKVTPTSALLDVTAQNIPKQAGQVNVEKYAESKYNSDTMAFTLTHLSTGTKYVSQEVVTTSPFMFTQWKQGATVLGANELPFGKYTLTESLEGDHYQFNSFIPTYGVSLNPEGDIASFTLNSGAPTLDITAINWVFEKGTIAIKSVPNLSFGVHNLGDVKSIANRTADAVVEVESTLRVTETWKLTASSTPQANGLNPLSYQMLKYSTDGVNFTYLDVPITVLNQDSLQTGDIYSVTWAQNTDDGIVAEVRYDPSLLVGEYKSVITWTLSDAP